MALITCPNCGRGGISTKARFCVGCHCSMERINELMSTANEGKERRKEQIKGAMGTPSSQENDLLELAELLSSLVPHKNNKAEEKPKKEIDKGESCKENIKNKPVKITTRPFECDDIDRYLSSFDDEGARDKEDYLSEYRACIENLLVNDWFYPDMNYEETEQFKSSSIPFSEMRYLETGIDNSPNTYWNAESKTIDHNEDRTDCEIEKDDLDAEYDEDSDEEYDEDSDEGYEEGIDDEIEEAQELLGEEYDNCFSENEDEGSMEEDDYLGEYRDYMDNLLNDDWFYPD